VSDLVEAAGGVVIRGEPGDRDVLLVHRPRYDDWSLPKGKLDGGESHEEAAVREVEEETGWRCALGAPLPEVRYVDAAGRPKRVRYWLMRGRHEDTWRPTDEVDDRRWAGQRDAAAMLSHDHDRGILEAATALDDPISLVRHAKAMARDAWHDDDDLRPLSEKGLGQAAGLLAQLGLTQVRRVVSSPATRCIQTVERLARDLDRPVEPIEALREGTSADQALHAIRSIAGPSVACTHGDVVAAIVRSIPRGERDADATGWKKGSTWVLARDAGEPVDYRYVPPPDGRG
jgi:8-oxo-dGTP diphosphatase